MADARLDIAKLEHLALLLEVPQADILDMARQMHRHVRTEWRRVRGKLRRIMAPKRRLKSLQRRIAGRLLGGIPVAESAHAYRRGRSTFTAARPHVGKPFLASLDVKDFFPGIHYTRVERLWRELGCSPDVARVLTQLTTYEYHLPLGADPLFFSARGPKRLTGKNGLGRRTQPLPSYVTAATRWSPAVWPRATIGSGGHAVRWTFWFDASVAALRRHQESSQVKVADSRVRLGFPGGLRAFDGEAELLEG